MTQDLLVATRRSLHAVAELVIAGPQQVQHDRIELAVTDTGFGAVASALAVAGDQLVGPHGSVRLAGTVRSLAAAAGVEPVQPRGYQVGSGVGLDEPLTFDPASLRRLLAAFVEGNEALRSFAPQGTPVLWPEHFDVAIDLDEVNYGVSPGDEPHPTPYAYVGPWAPRSGPFWNAPFGALRDLAELPDAADIAAFFAAGSAAARS